MHSFALSGIRLGILCLALASAVRVCAADPVNPSFPLPGGRPFFHTSTDKTGLPQNSVQCMAFDQKGYLWIGTQDGAAVFNGRVWTVVNMPNRLESNFVRALLTASDGSVWFGTDGGGVLHLKDGTWKTYGKSDGLPHNQVKCLIEATLPGSQQTILVATRGGVSAFENGRWKPFDTPEKELAERGTLCLLESKNPTGSSTLWVGTQGKGLFRLENGSWTRFDTSTGLIHNIVFCLLETRAPDGAKTLWAGTYGGGLARFENGQWTGWNTSSGLPNNIVLSLTETVSQDGTPAVWVGTYGGGVARFEKNTWTIFDIDRAGLPNNVVLSLLETRLQGRTRTVWIGTNGGGLARFEPGQWSVLDRASGLPNNLVLALLETIHHQSHAFWIGTRGGLVRFENGTRTLFDETSGLPNNIVTCLLETTSPTGQPVIWVGTNGGGLARFENGRWTQITAASGLPSDVVLSLYETRTADGGSVVWVGTDGGGVGRYDGKTWQTIDSRSGLPNNVIFGFLETTAPDGKRTLWIGTNGGLVHNRNGQWETIGISAGLPNDGINSLAEIRLPDGTPTLWVGTYGGAAWCRLDKPTDGWTVLSDTSRPALPNNTIYHLRQDIRGRIYLFTNKGIARLTHRAKPAEDGAVFDLATFTTEDGLPSNECNLGASLIDSAGRLWAGTVEGAACFDLSQEFEDLTPKPLCIERLLINGQVQPDSISKTTLPYNQNNLLFEFALLNYFRAGDTRYRFQLEGFDATESAWTTEPRKEYTNLGSGPYTFKVWGKDYAGNISGPVTVAIRIAPAPWRTWWAYLLYGVTGSLLIFGGVRWRLQTLEHRNQVLEARVQERTNQLAQKNEELNQNNVALDRKTVELIEKNTELDRLIGELQQAKAVVEAKNQELLHKNEELVRSKEELVQSNQRADRIFSALADVLPGTVLDGKYRLESKIGAGGFGTVFRATHLALQKPIAVKVFRPTAGNATTESLNRFFREGISSCRVNHPNAVTVLDSGISETGIAYLVMELLVGRSLTQELKLFGRCSPLRCAQILVPVCQALAKAHASGLIHRDIKPDNIFLHQTDHGEVVKVVDFGIAKLMGETTDQIEMHSLTEAGKIIGTPTYMAPERFADKPYDGKTDVYSVGVVAYQMLSGDVPFRATGGEVISIILAHLREMPASLRRALPEIPEVVETLVFSSLAKDPQARPTAEDLARELAAAVDLKAADAPVQATMLLTSDAGEGDLVEVETETIASIVPSTGSATRQLNTGGPSPQHTDPLETAKTLTQPKIL